MSDDTCDCLSCALLSAACDACGIALDRADDARRPVVCYSGEGNGTRYTYCRRCWYFGTKPAVGPMQPGYTS